MNPLAYAARSVWDFVLDIPLYFGKTRELELPPGCVRISTARAYPPGTIPDDLSVVVAEIAIGLEDDDYPRRFLEAVPPGADLQRVYHRFIAWLEMDPEVGAHRHVVGGHAGRWTALWVETQAETHQRIADGLDPWGPKWQSFRPKDWKPLMELVMRPDRTFWKMNHSRAYPVFADKLIAMAAADPGGRPEPAPAP